jgi:predicted RNase H-like HicB family nuclease
MIARDRSAFECRAFWSNDDRGYIAVCAAFPRLSAFGVTAAAALAELESVLDEAADHYRSEGWPLPAHSPS